MKNFPYIETLIILAILLAVTFAGWVTVYHVAEQPISRITIHEDGPEMRKATKMIMDQVAKESK